VIDERVLDVFDVFDVFDVLDDRTSGALRPSGRGSMRQNAFHSGSAAAAGVGPARSDQASRSSSPQERRSAAGTTSRGDDTSPGGDHLAG